MKAKQRQQQAIVSGLTPPSEASPHDKAGVEALRSKITDLVGKSPEKAATILTDWLRQAAVSAEKRKKAGKKAA